MSVTSLVELFERNSRHVDSLPEEYFADVEAGQKPATVSMCCSDSRGAQEGMWSVETPGWLFTPSTIGNQVWDRHDGERVVDGSMLYPMAYTETKMALVVGHTGCGAITDALDTVQNGRKAETPPGVEKWISLLKPVVEDGLEDDRVDPDRDVSLVDQLVEFNVDRQVEFLIESDDVPEDVTVYGFVYDFQRVYGDRRGRAYLVNADGDTEDLDELVPAEYAEYAKRLL
ncbi:MAG: carbonic anhydrase [Halovenus sp.]